MKFTILSFTLILFLFTGLNLMAAEEVYWIDVRSAEEFAEIHVDDAVNIPHTEIAERISEVTDDKNADIRVYCRSGRRSGLAKETLNALGYTRVTNEGGINDVLPLAN